ncbi:YwqJ-related putative deaminase [Paenibacillus sp. EZ-K15]|uniref:YwqJ-related putative deaminase n=1 Tax=Paenibacillus sp. EZ-K15 TaxID=2044275 RepID=UPI001F290835|nr:YwqJ-related putative deaminase [Paenibacillus sp. EZ-K15]
MAVNEALKKNPNARIEDIVVNVIRTGVNKKKSGGTMFKCCPHCAYILEGFEIISEVPKVGR